MFLVFLFLCVFYVFAFYYYYFFKNNIVTELNVSEFNQMYEILGSSLCWLLILSLKTVPNVSAYRPDSLFQEQLSV